MSPVASIRIRYCTEYIFPKLHIYCTEMYSGTYPFIELSKFSSYKQVNCPQVQSLNNVSSILLHSTTESSTQSSHEKLDYRF